MPNEHLAKIYSGDLNGFTARRDALAKRLRRDGDAQTAKELKALRKPTRVAWALNQVSHGQPKLRDRLLAAGEQLRAHPDRKSVERERALVAELAEAAGARAESVGAPLSEAAAEKARQTLHAVALDEDVRSQFESGVLTREHEAVSIGLMGPAPAPEAAAQGAAREEAAKKKKELESAREHEREMRRQQSDAKEALSDARREADRAQRALEAARVALDEATERAEAASRQVRDLSG